VSAVSLALAAALAAPARGQILASIEDEQHALFEGIAPGVVVVASGGAISAGFFAAPGLVVTSAHGVLGAREATVTLRDGRTVVGQVIASSPRGLDLALLRVAATAERVLAPAADAALRAGDVVVAVGHDDGSRWSFSAGMVSNPQADGPDGALVRLQLALRPGASGGPVVSRAGRVVGVVVHGGPPAATFAVRSDAVLRAFPELAADAAAARGDAGRAIAGLR
jgi:S1-C subfamily serine protease